MRMNTIAVDSPPGPSIWKFFNVRKWSIYHLGKMDEDEIGWEVGVGLLEEGVIL